MREESQKIWNKFKLHTSGHSTALLFGGLDYSERERERVCLCKCVRVCACESTGVCERECVFPRLPVPLILRDDVKPSLVFPCDKYRHRQGPYIVRNLYPLLITIKEWGNSQRSLT